MNTIIYKKFLDASDTEIHDVNFIDHLGKKNIIIKALSNEEHLSYFLNNSSPFSVKYTFAGQEYYNVDNITVSATPENFVIIPPGKHYSSLIDSKEEVESLMLFLSESFTHDLFNPSIFLKEGYCSDLADFLDQKKVIPLNPELKKLVIQFKSLLESDSYSDELTLLMSDIVLQTFNEFNNIWKQTLSYDAVKSSTKAEVCKRLYRVKDYIYCNYKEELDIDNFAKISFLNRYYLIREFKSFFGITPYQMLLNRRLEIAKEKIKHSGDPISDIVTEVGYNNIPNFYHGFRKQYGIRPSEMRA